MNSDTFGTFFQAACNKFGFIEAYEEDQIRAFAGVVSPARRFVDVGANRGLYSYIANHLMTGGQIHLLEADPRLAAKLEAEVVSWEDNGNRITVHAVAAGDRDCVLPFRIGPLDTLGSLAASDLVATSTESVDVPVTPLDALMPAEPRTVFKIDVEGFEFRVLQGATRHLAAPDSQLLVELHGWGDSSIAKYPCHVLGLMRRAGYRATRAGQTNNYTFNSGMPLERWVSFLRYAPIACLKAVLRRMGFLQFYHRARSRFRRGPVLSQGGLRSASSE